MADELARRYLFDPRESLEASTVHLLCDGPEIFPAILRTISQARLKIGLEIYMIRNDGTGIAVRDALVEAARRGCDVRLIYDDFGSLWTYANFFQPLVDAGGRLLRFHPITPWRGNWAWRSRDHRKMLLVDDDLVLVGGVNLADESSRPVTEGGFHDLAVEVRGPAALQAWELFEETWRSRGARLVPRQLIGALWPFPRQTSQVSVEVIGSGRIRDRGRIRRSILYAISQAKRSIHLVNPYFLPDRGFILALGKAVERGVRVCVIAPRYTDVMMVDLASMLTQQRLLRRSVEVYVWPGMVHAKTVLVDGVWISVGSYNFDHLSLFHNLEVVVNAVDLAAGEQLEHVFERDIEKSTRVTEGTWKALPVWKRVLARFFYRLRKLL